MNEGESIQEVAENVPEEPGFFYIVRLAKGRPEVVFVGSAGTVKKNGQVYSPFLREAICIFLNDKFVKQKFSRESIDALDIYWAVTIDDTAVDIPAYASASILQSHFDVFGELPPWNKQL